MRYALLAIGLFAVCHSTANAQQLPAKDEVRAAMRRAAEFYSKRLAIHGGYHDQYASDLSFGRSSKRTEGPNMVSVTGSGTPTVGLAFLSAWQATGDDLYLNAARQAGLALVQGQLCSGGWDYGIQFDPQRRKPLRYRIDVGCETPRDEPCESFTNLDNNSTQGAMRFLMRLDRALEFKDSEIHRASLFALQGLKQGQYPNGAWPQRFNTFPKAEDFPVLAAAAPNSWSHEWPGSIFYGLYTINDECTLNMIDVMFEAHRIYGDDAYLDSAKRGGDFLILAQMPNPQPAWAQQYNVDMTPAWGRKFEPPGICGRESQDVIRTLLLLYRETRMEKYLRPIPKALDYLTDSIQKADDTSNGRDYLCRFYETKTNRPIFITRGTRLYVGTDAWRLLDGYEVTFDPAADLVSHYTLKLGTEQLSNLREQYEYVRRATPASLRRPDQLSSLTPWRASAIPEDSKDVDFSRLPAIIASLDGRGAWVQAGSIGRANRVVGLTPNREMIIVVGDQVISIAKEQTISVYEGSEPPQQSIIRSGAFAANVRLMCEYLKK